MHNFLNVFNLSDVLVPAGNNAVHMDKEPQLNPPPNSLRTRNKLILIVPPALREQPFDFYGGGGRKTSQKKIPALISGKKTFSGPKGRQKNHSGLP